MTNIHYLISNVFCLHGNDKKTCGQEYSEPILFGRKQTSESIELEAMVKDIDSTLEVSSISFLGEQVNSLRQ